MKKLQWGLAALLLAAFALPLEAGEKRYRIRLVSAKGDVFGKPVSFQEVVPTPAPLGPPGEYFSPAPAPIPVPHAGLAPIPDPHFSSHGEFQTVELYHRVKYEDLRNVHPCAVKKIVAVKDPCARPSVCGSCAPPCVYVMICVPPCDKFRFDVKRKDHSKVEYDYGDYEIEITSKNGIVYVDYDD